MKDTVIKNIIFVYDQAYFSGGAANIVIGEAIELAKRRYNVSFFSAIGPVDERLVQNGVSVVCLNERHIAKTKNLMALLKGIWNCNAYIKLKEFLNYYNADNTVVHVHGWTKALSAAVFKACHEKGFRTFITLHEYFSVCQNGGLFDYKKNKICDKTPGTVKCYLCNCDKRNYFNKIYRNIRRVVQDNTLKKLKPNVIYITEFSRKKICNLPFIPAKEYFLHNFVNVRKHERVKAEDNKDFLFIGRVSDEKGIELFCEAVNRTNVSGIVIGDGPLKEKYELLFENIKFVGWKNQDELRTYIINARALIIASKWYETMGLTVIEMQQYGVPCLIPRECAASEYVLHGASGELFQIGNLESLIQAINKFKKFDYVKKLSETFYSDLNFEKYSIINHVDSLLKIYEDA